MRFPAQAATSRRDGISTLDRVQLHALAGATAYELASIPGVSDGVQRALAVAAASGAGVVDAVGAARDAADVQHDQERAVQVASAQSRSVAVALVVAPLVLAPIISGLFGVDVFAFYRQSAGRTVLVGSMALTTVGLGLMYWLVRRIRVPPEDELADLIATAMSSGCTSATALRVVATYVPRHATSLRSAALGLQFGLKADGAVLGGSDAVRRITTVLVDAEALGAPVVDVLRRLARQLRAEQLSSVRAASERLPAQLTFPTTLALLPAGLTVIAAPIIAEVLAGLTVISP